MSAAVRFRRRPSLAPIVLAGLLLGFAPLLAARARAADSVSGSIWGSPAGVDPCASEDLLERRLAADPSLRERREMFELLVREAERKGLIPGLEARRGATTTTTTYVIPVAVHIVHTNGPENIQDSQVLSQIWALNRDFANSPSNPSPAVNTNIQFCLAQGLPANSSVVWSTTPGITRDYSTQTIHTYGNPASEAALKAISYLPSSQYLNIWVVNHIAGYTGGVIGYATYPGAVPPALDGIVMRYTAFGSNYTPHGGPYNLLPFNDDGKILTHEVGHYLNLFHTFHGGCAPPGDQVSDTPPEQVNRSNCPVPVPTSCTSAPDPIENFMDYTNDPCRYAFTAGQAARMQAAINQYRNVLVSGASLVQAGCTAGLNALIVAAPTQLCAGGSVQFTTPASGAGWTYSWSFPGGTPSSANTQNASVTYPSAGAWTVSLTVTDGGTNSNTSFDTLYVSSCTPIQNACTNWTFAQSCAVSFATGMPVAFTGAQCASFEAATTMSSASGALLFYSDGDRVFDATHAVMPNGAGIAAGGSAHNGVIAGRRPGSPSQYFLFQVRMQEAYPTTNLISYSVIDMTLNSGLGDIPVGQKNIPISLPGSPTQMLEALALIPHCNGTDWWLVSEGWNGTATKVFVTPITSAGPGASTAYPTSGGHGLNPGSIVPTADGTMFATCAIANADVTVYDFDRATGAVTVHLPTTALNVYTDLAFSPNKQLIYYNYKVGSVYGVRQLKLATLEVREIVTHQQCAVNPGPDGKIYLGPEQASWLHTINFPDNFNTNDQNECGFNPASILFPPPMANSIWGALPNMVQACTGPTILPAQFTYTITNCTTVQFQSTNCAGPYNWNFGDNTTGSGKTVTHTYAGPGTYTVTLTVPAASPTIATQSVTIGLQPVTIAGSNTVCANPNSYSVIGPAGYTYQWSVSGGTPTFASGNSIDVTFLTTGGSVTLTATDPVTGCTSNLIKNVGPCPTCFKPPLGMCAWWPLDEPSGTQAIETVLGNHGADINAPAHVTGQVKRGRQFNGAGKYVQVNDAAALNFGTGDLTIDAWVRTTASSGFQSIVDKRFADPEVGYAMYLRSGRLAFRLADPSNASGTEYWSATTPFVADGQWHHVAAVEERSDAATGTRLYVDGSLVASFPGYSPSGNVTNSEKLLIGAGASFAGPATFFDGTIDEVELFQRALSSADVLGIAQADTVGKCKEFLYVPALASFCRDGNDVTLTVQVCNHSSAQQTYQLAFIGTTGANCTWTGPVNFQVIGPNPVTVPANSCAPVTFKVFRPPGMPLYSTLCYQVTMTNVASSYSTVARGSVTLARRWCFLPIVPAKSWGHLGSGATMSFVMVNTSDEPLDTPFMARVIPAETWAGVASGIGMNGLAPDQPFIGVASAAPGDSVVIDLFCYFTQERAFRAYDIALTMDEDGDGMEDAASTVLFRYASDSTGTVSVPVPVVAEPKGVSLAVSPNPTRDRTIVRFTLAARSEVELALYDVAGRRVRTIFEGSREAGPGSVIADCRTLPRGVYLVQLRTSGAVAAQRLVMLK